MFGRLLTFFFVKSINTNTCNLKTMKIFLCIIKAKLFIVTITLFEKAMTHPFLTYLEIFRGRKASIFNLYLCRKKTHVVELLLLQILAILHFTWNWEVFKILPFFHRIVSKTRTEDLLVTLTGLYPVLYSFIFFSSISD